MKLENISPTLDVDYKQLLAEPQKLASRQTDHVNEINFKGTRENHRISFRYNKSLERNVVYLVENATGKIVRKSPSDAEVDQIIRIQRLMGLHIDTKI